MQVKKQQLETDMEKQTRSKLGKEYLKSVHCHPAYLIYMFQCHSPVSSCPRPLPQSPKVKQAG